MPKTIEPGDCVVWLTEDGAMSGTVHKTDQFGVNITDEDGKVHRITSNRTPVFAVEHENRLKLGYALSSALRDHRKRLDASHVTLKLDRETALGKWAL